MVVREFPFQQIELSDGMLRIFSDAEADELVWHMDREDRIVECQQQGGGWMLQIENMLPVEMLPGVKFTIPKNTYHRVIKGAGELTVRIWKS